MEAHLRLAIGITMRRIYYPGIALCFLAFTHPSLAEDALFIAPTTPAIQDIPQGTSIDEGNLVFTNKRSDDEKKSKWLDEYVHYQYGDNADPLLATRVSDLHKALHDNIPSQAARVEIVLDSYLVKGYVPDRGIYERLVARDANAYRPQFPLTKAGAFASIVYNVVANDTLAHRRQYRPTGREYCEATIVSTVNGVRLEVSARESLIGSEPVMKRLTERLLTDFVTQLLAVLDQ
jgi:hypothetical protein